MSKVTSAPLTVAGEAIALPVILIAGDVLAKITSLTQDAAALKIEDAADAQRAANLQNEIHGLSRDLEKDRVKAKAPFLQYGELIDGAAKKEAKRLQASIDLLKKEQIRWADHVEELARVEAERIRKEQAELARQAAVAERARKDAEEAQRRAAEAAAAADAPPPDEGDDMAALGDELAVEDAKDEEARIADQTAALAKSRLAVVPTAKPVGLTWRTTLKHTVTDVGLLPRALTTVTANDAEIRRLYCQGWKEGDPAPSVPGITFTIDKNPAPSGRR